MTRLTSAQRRALDGESDEVATPRDLAIPPNTPMIDSCYDPGGCTFVFPDGPLSTGAPWAGEYAGWRCQLTEGHTTPTGTPSEHVPGYPPGFDVPGPTYGEGPRAPVALPPHLALWPILKQPDPKEVT